MLSDLHKFKVEKKAMSKNGFSRIPHHAVNTKWERDSYSYDGTKIKQNTALNNILSLFWLLNVYMAL